MKENYFFKHDFNARTDPKLQNVIMEMGLMGVGLYWCIIEQLYEQGGELPLTNVKSIAFTLHAEADDVLRLINDFGLFRKDRKKFWSESVRRRISDREDLSEKRRNAGKIGNRKRWNKASQNNNECDDVASQNNSKCDKETSQKDDTDDAAATHETSQSLAIKIEDKDKDKDIEREIERTHTHEDFLKRFFSVENQLRLENICREIGMSLEVFRKTARQVVNEWNVTAQEHEDYNDAARHLISLIRIKAEKRGSLKNVKSADTWEEEERKRRDEERKKMKREAISREDYERIKKA